MSSALDLVNLICSIHILLLLLFQNSWIDPVTFFFASNVHPGATGRYMQKHSIMQFVTKKMRPNLGGTGCFFIKREK
jgi:hypothetical protein